MHARAICSSRRLHVLGLDHEHERVGPGRRPPGWTCVAATPYRSPSSRTRSSRRQVTMISSTRAPARADQPGDERLAHPAAAQEGDLASGHDALLVRSRSAPAHLCGRAHTVEHRPADRPLPMRRAARKASVEPPIRHPRPMLGGMPLHRMIGDPQFNAPVVIAAFDGWIDSAGAATACANHLGAHGEVVVTVRQRRARSTIALASGARRRRRHARRTCPGPRSRSAARRSTNATCSCWSDRSPTTSGARSRTDVLDLCLRLGVHRVDHARRRSPPRCRTRAPCRCSRRRRGTDCFVTGGEGTGRLLRGTVRRAQRRRAHGRGCGCAGGRVLRADPALRRGRLHTGNPRPGRAPRAAPRRSAFRWASSPTRRWRSADGSTPPWRPTREPANTSSSSNRRRATRQMPSGDELASEIERFLRTQQGAAHARRGSTVAL